MLVKFFLYRIDVGPKQGNMMCLLPDMPQNSGFQQSNEIHYDGSKLMAGINWTNVDWEYSNDGTELDETKQWHFDTGTNEITELR